MMKASLQAKPINNVDLSSSKPIPTIEATVTFPSDEKPITAQRASRRFVQEYVGQNELFPDEVDKVQSLSNFSIKADDQTVQSQIQTVNGQRSLKVSINIDDKTRLLEAKKQVLAQRETVSQIFENVRSQNEIEGASKGLLTGVYDSGKQAYDLVAHPVDSAANLVKLATSPLETSRQLKQAFGEKYDEFVAAPPARKAEMLAYLPGQAIGNILLGKGVGIIAKTPAVAKITSATSKAIAETKLGQSSIKVADSINIVKTVIKEEALKRVAIVLDKVVKDPKAASLTRASPTITTIFDNKVPTVIPKVETPYISKIAAIDEIAAINNADEIAGLYGGGQRGIDGQWTFKEGKTAEEAESIRLEFLNQKDAGRVQNSLSDFGIKADRNLLEAVKKYNFDSKGIVFMKDSYDSWKRLAKREGTVNDARYVVHELRKVRELQKIQQETGFDFMGKNVEKLPREEKNQWRSDFDKYYGEAHSKALETEYDFLAREIKTATNNRTQVSRNIVVASDPTRDEALRNMIVDRKPLNEHSDFYKWQQKGSMPVDVGASARERLGLPKTRNITLKELIDAVKRQPLKEK
jgi:hypothetical protein